MAYHCGRAMQFNVTNQTSGITVLEEEVMYQCQFSSVSNANGPTLPDCQCKYKYVKLIFFVYVDIIFYAMLNFPMFYETQNFQKLSISLFPFRYWMSLPSDTSRESILGTQVS